jgi:drug/metabolite transporter (DMT)-like permease
MSSVDRILSLIVILGRGVLGAAMGVLLGALINVLFLRSYLDELEGTSPNRLIGKYGHVAAPLTAALLLAAVCCVFGGIEVRGRIRTAMLGLIAGIVIGSLVGRFVFPFLICPRPDDPELRMAYAFRYKDSIYLGLLLCIPTGAFLGFATGLRRRSN